MIPVKRKLFLKSSIEENMAISNTCKQIKSHERGEHCPYYNRSMLVQ